MSKRVLTREYGRAYSLFRVYLIDRATNQDIKELIDGVAVDPSCVVYRGTGLVFGYHSEGAFQDIFQKVGIKAQDESWARARIKEALELFNWLKPYFEQQLKIATVAKLRVFFDKYTSYFTLQGIIQVIPNIDELSDDIKGLAAKAREEIQEYNESAEVVFKATLEMLYPHLKRRTQFLLPEDVWSGIANSKQIGKDIEDREKGFVFYRGQLHAGENVDEVLDGLGIVLSDQFVNKDVTELTGQVACKGQVGGTVKIISGLDDLEKIRAGDILVTTMTMPSYIVAMERAAAFVTDEGGVTCHAAIISREMNKPCIIGTKIATNVLKDGDEVEVDADNGVVRILRRS